MNNSISMMIKILDQIKMAVATSSSSHSFKLKTENHSGLFSLFDKMVKKNISGNFFLIISTTFPTFPSIRFLGTTQELERPSLLLIFFWSQSSFLFKPIMIFKKVAAADLGEEPEFCLVFEDAPLGVAAGRCSRSSQSKSLS